MPTTLIITNDFPPRVGGIETFVRTVCELLDNDVVVLTSHSVGADDYDQNLPFEVIRAGRLLLPTPRTTRQAVEIFQRSGASRVIFGAAAPLSLMAPALRRAGAGPMVAISHGHEVWWSLLPGARTLLRRMGDSVDHLSTISDYAQDRIVRALSSEAAARVIRLPPPVDLDRFTLAARPAEVDHGRLSCVAAGRFVSRKGFDHLLRAWALLIMNWKGPIPELVLVGDGPRRRQLERLVHDLEIAESVTFTGAVDHQRMIMIMQQATVFALPVRTRLGGLDPEGLGLVFVEAAACGVPVIVGNSGGAPETLRHEETGYLVAGVDHDDIADRLRTLLSDRALADQLGQAGRRFVSERFGTDQARATLRTALRLEH